MGPPSPPFPISFRRLQFKCHLCQEQAASLPTHEEEKKQRLQVLTANPRPWALTQVAQEILKEPECRGRGGEERTCTLTDAPCKRERDTGMCEISFATWQAGDARCSYLNHTS